jgi:hypothetical protein
MTKAPTKRIAFASILNNRKYSAFRVLVLFLFLCGALKQILLSPPAPVRNGLIEQTCRVQIASACDTGRTHAVDQFTAIYRNAVWGVHPSSHTRSGSGSAMQGAFETIVNLDPKFRELNITSIADIPSGDCGWQFALTTVNTAQAYFGGDITPHVAEENAERYKDHFNKVFAFWDLVECPIPRWYTSCNASPRAFDVIIVRDVIQHMPIHNAMRAVKSIVEESETKYLAMTSFTKDSCVDQCQTSITEEGGFYHNNLHCTPWNIPEPFFKFASHLHFPEEGDFMELYRVEDLKDIVAHWPESPCGKTMV